MPERRAKRNPAQASRKDPWGEENLLTSKNSPIIDVDLVKLLAKPEAWTCLEEDEKKEILSLLPEHMQTDGDPEDPDSKIPPIPQQFLRYSNHWRSAVRQFQVDLEAGKYDPKWLSQAQQAMEERARGDFDDFKEQQYEEFWGQKQKFNKALAAGESSKVKLKDLIRNNLFRVNDVWKYNRLVKKGRDEKVFVEKECKIVAIEDERMTFLIPGGRRIFPKPGSEIKNQNVPHSITSDLNYHYRSPGNSKAQNSSKRIRISEEKAGRYKDIVSRSCDDQMNNPCGKLSAVPDESLSKQDDDSPFGVTYSESKLFPPLPIGGDKKKIRNETSDRTTGSTCSKNALYEDFGIPVVVSDPIKKRNSSSLDLVSISQTAAQSEMSGNAPDHLSVEGAEAVVVQTDSNHPGNFENKKSTEIDDIALSEKSSELSSAKSIVCPSEPDSSCSENRHRLGMCDCISQVRVKPTVPLAANAAIHNESQVITSGISNKNSDPMLVYKHYEDQWKEIKVNRKEFISPVSGPSDPPDEDPDSDVVFPGVAGPNSLGDKILKIDGRVDRIPNGNAWKDFRCLRDNQDMGSIWEMRQAWFVKHYG